MPTYPRIGDFVKCPKCLHYGAEHGGGVTNYMKCTRCTCQIKDFTGVVGAKYNSSGALIGWLLG